MFLFFTAQGNFVQSLGVSYYRKRTDNLLALIIHYPDFNFFFRFMTQIIFTLTNYFVLQSSVKNNFYETDTFCPGKLF